MDDCAKFTLVIAMIWTLFACVRSNEWLRVNSYEIALLMIDDESLCSISLLHHGGVGS